VTTNMTITRGNIIAGPCSSFTVDGNPIGGTSGGVTMERKTTMVDLEIDQIVGSVRKVPSKDVITVTTTMAESTLANLQVAWGIATAPVVATTPASETLDVGVVTSAIEHALVFVGPCPSGTYTSRTVTLHKAVSVATAKLSFEKDKEQAYQVTFDILPDLTQTAGSEYGTIVDQ
jgi:hypothetical protein